MRDFKVGEQNKGPQRNSVVYNTCGKQPPLVWDSKDKVVACRISMQILKAKSHDFPTSELP